MRQTEGLPVLGGGKPQTARGFLREEGMDTSAFISVGAVWELCFVLGQHWVSQAGVKEGIQTEESGMFTQPGCFPQGEDAFLALQQQGEEQITPLTNNSSNTWNRDSDVLIFWSEQVPMAG